MRGLWILFGVYLLLGLLFFVANPDYVVGTFSVNLIFGKVETVLVPVLYLISAAWMLLLLLIVQAQRAALQQEMNRLKASLHDREMGEVRRLKEELETLLAQFADEIRQEIQSLRQERPSE